MTPPPDDTRTAPPGTPGDGEPLPPDAGRYAPLRFHKKGGMGRVFVARDAELNRDVALKDIRPEWVANPARVRQFVFEAEVTGGLEHPGVVPVYGLGRAADGRPFYAMRFVQGGTLADAIRAFHADADPHPSTDRSVAFRRLLQAFLQVCQTVAYAHSRGVIHRDLKPSNVLLGPFGETLVVDWGLARQVRSPNPDAAGWAPVEGAAETRSLPGTAIGSPPYWSPEQARGEPDRHDERTDVYGLGAVLFDILAGRSPHPTGVHPPEPPTARGFGTPVDDDLDEIVRAALSPDRDARPATAAELAVQVERWLADQPIAAQRATVHALELEFARDESRADVGEQLARQRVALGLMYLGLSRPLRAVRSLTQAARWYADRIAAGAADARDRAELATCHLHLARGFDLLGLPAQAGEERDAAGGLYARLMATDPDEYRANLASIVATHAGAAPFPRPAAAPEQTLHADRPADGEPTRTFAYPGFEPPADPALRPADIGRGYDILRPLGYGGLGAVYLARDVLLDRLVAIKDFRANLTGDLLRRATLELRVTARLVHPNVVRVYTYGTHAADGRPFMVMEYLPGRTLKDEAAEAHRAAGRRFDPRSPAFRRLIEAVAQVCDAAHFAHTQGVIHRDPKPANVMVGDDGRAVLIDWGLAKVLGATADPQSPSPAGDPLVTHAGALLGTPAYMAPEQVSGGAAAAGPATDVYALGVGLYEVLTGGLPHLADGGVHDLLRQVLTARPQKPSDRRPGLPAELDAVCAAAMAYRPADRYPTAAALAADLRAFLAGTPLAVRNRGRLRRLWDQLTARS